MVRWANEVLALEVSHALLSGPIYERQSIHNLLCCSPPARGRPIRFGRRPSSGQVSDRKSLGPPPRRRGTVLVCIPSYSARGIGALAGAAGGEPYRDASRRQDPNPGSCLDRAPELRLFRA